MELGANQLIENTFSKRLKLYQQLQGKIIFPDG